MELNNTILLIFIKIFLKIKLFILIFINIKIILILFELIL